VAVPWNVTEKAELCSRFGDDSARAQLAVWTDAAYCVTSGREQSPAAAT
jgi:hypothetical protein